MGTVFDQQNTIDADGNCTISGNLTVSGTTTTISSTTLTVADKVVVIASGAADSSAADGAGISVDGASATLLYDHTGTQWEMSKPLEITGALSTTTTATVGTDLTVSGGDISYGNGQNATASVTATAHDAAGKNLTITAGPTTAGTTNNIAGGSLTLQAGQGKGSGAGGDIVFQTANAAGSGSSLNALATALTISDDKSATFTGHVVFAESTAVKCGSNAILSDSSGTMTLSNIDSLDATTEATIESAIDTLSNLASIGTITTGVWNGSAIGTTYITDNAVTLAKMAGITRGSIIVGNASGDPALLGVGSNTYVLTSDGTDAAWAAASSGADANDSNTILHMQMFT